ncbi:MAG: hypothetical protein Q8Q49_06230 [bacterium]|nr:hypothetical protein [bacterium]
MKRFFFFLSITTVIGLMFLLPKEQAATSSSKLWSVQAVDTMKYSRDPSREKLNDPSYDLVIAKQVQDVARIGATHIAIATPYDEEFLPIMKRWVQAARRNQLKVWFRGNLSGWEKWFGYSKITREEHIAKTKAFILNHPELFEDGDIFMGCPECENGGPGDPRQTGDVAAYRRFLIQEHASMRDAFRQIGKNVTVDYNSMNGDVARLVMDRDTTSELGGTVVIDHYVRTPEQLVRDVQEIARDSGGSVILGEFGVPILDINGQMTEDEQANWVSDALKLLVSVPELKGINYWVNLGGSTSLYNQDGSPRKVVGTLTAYFNPKILSIRIVDPLGDEIGNATVSTLNRSFAKDQSVLSVPVAEQDQRATVRADGYDTKYVTFSPAGSDLRVVLDPKKENLLYTLRRLLKYIIRI